MSPTSLTRLLTRSPLHPEGDLHVLYLHQYFGTRDGVGGTRSYEFARDLVTHGHRVTIVTARRADSGIADVRRQQIDGIEVISLGGRSYSNRLGTGARMLEFARFYMACESVEPHRASS